MKTQFRVEFIPTRVQAELEVRKGSERPVYCAPVQSK